MTKYEDILVGVQLKGTRQIASFDPQGRRVWPPDGTSEMALEQDLLLAARVLAHTQLSLQAPALLTRRTTPHARETSWGVGDLNLGARHDFVRAGEWPSWPGLAVLAGLTLPTGTPPEKAKRPLATDATGIGAFQAHIGGSIEKTAGPWLFSLTALVAQRTARSVGQVHERLGTQLTTIGAAGYTFENSVALAFSMSLTVEANAHLDGKSVPNSGRRQVTTGLSGAWPFRDDWRLQGGWFLDPPISHLGVNTIANIGASLALLRTWS
ncbi:MAG: hypothetical protein U0165_01955 [Polyangiaceae bacterium]